MASPAVPATVALMKSRRELLLFDMVIRRSFTFNATTQVARLQIRPQHNLPSCAQRSNVPTLQRANVLTFQLTSRPPARGGPSYQPSFDSMTLQAFPLHASVSR